MVNQTTGDCWSYGSPKPSEVMMKTISGKQANLMCEELHVRLHLREKEEKSLEEGAWIERSIIDG